MKATKTEPINARIEEQINRVKKLSDVGLFVGGEV
jgi:hypothetical protein